MGILVENIPLKSMYCVYIFNLGLPMNMRRFSPLAFFAGIPPQADMSSFSASSTRSAITPSSPSAVMDSRAVECAMRRCRCWTEPTRSSMPVPRHIYCKNIAYFTCVIGTSISVKKEKYISLSSFVARVKTMTLSEISYQLLWSTGYPEKNLISYPTGYRISSQISHRISGQYPAGYSKPNIFTELAIRITKILEFSVNISLYCRN